MFLLGRNRFVFIVFLIFYMWHKVLSDKFFIKKASIVASCRSNIVAFRHYKQQRRSRQQPERSGAPVAVGCAVAMTTKR
jgi:hypothetical protein